MSPGIGMYPGGPHAAPRQEDDRSPHIPRVEELAEYIDRRSTEQRHRNQRKRLIIALLLSLSLAGVLGLVVGRSAHTTAEELAEELEAKGPPANPGISKEVNRTLLELWKMEDLEVIRARRGR